VTNQVSSNQYEPPTGEAIASAQNEVASLRLLLAQRRLYSRAKRWQIIGWVGMLGIAIVAPLVSVIWPQLAIVAAGTAGVWIFFGRTTLHNLQRNRTEEAAAVQEEFDFSVFGMPEGINRTHMPTLEDLALIVGTDSDVSRDATSERLLNWYPIDKTQDGAVVVAICQRANASYSFALLRAFARLWIAAIVVWAIALTIVSSVVGISPVTFVLGVIFPVLPAFLDLIDYWRNIRRQATDRKDLVDTIEGKLAASAAELESGDLLVWQERLYELRRSTLQVPDSLYKFMRRSQESAMFTAANQLSKRVKRR
jgi:hypothetical protein